MPRLVVIAVVACLGLGLAYAVLRVRAPAPVPVAVVEPSPSPTVPPLIVVDVAGAVVRPGVVRLAYGARVGDAIGASGGVTPDADLSTTNRAALLRDGARVYVPHYGEVAPAGSVGNPSEDKVDLNHATAAELEQLPGIGPATAGRIIRSRDQRPFATIDDLANRGLVTARVLADIRDLLTIR